MRSPNLVSPRRQSGFSLIELIIVIGLGFLIYQIAFGNQDNANKGVDGLALTTQMQSLHVGVKNAFRGHYGDLTVPKFVESQQAPNDMVQGSGATATLQHSGRGSVTVAPADCNGGTDNCFTTTWAAIPSKNCLSAINSVSAQMQGITVGATSVKAVGGSYDRDAASTACAASPTLAVALTDG